MVNARVMEECVRLTDCLIDYDLADYDLIDCIQYWWIDYVRVIEERVRNQEWSGRVKDTREKMNKLYDENR